MSNSLQARCT